MHPQIVRPVISPIVALVSTLAYKQLPLLGDARQTTLVALTCSVLLALAACCAWLPLALQPFHKGARLRDDIGWPALLQQLPASLTAMFALVGVGDVLGGLVAAVAAYALGMALLTSLTGDTFAAFPAKTAAVGRRY